MQQFDLDLYKELHDFFCTHYAKLVAVSTRVRKEYIGNPDLLHVADTLYVIKKAEAISERIYKATKSIRQTCEKTLCHMWLVTSTDGEPVRTQWCTITPKVTVIPKLPSLKHDPKGYDAILKSLGCVDSDVRDYGAVQLYYPGFVEYCGFCERKGKPLPVGNEVEMYNKFGSRLRPACALLENDMSDLKLWSATGEQIVNPDSTERTIESYLQ